MNINPHDVPPSRIIEIGNKIKALASETGNEYLALNRGVNAVVPIDLNRVVKSLNLNEGVLQNYPVSHGSESFKQAVIQEYFDENTSTDMIAVTAGSISGIDLLLRVSKPTTVFLPAFFWGPYKYIAELNRHQVAYYETLERSFPSDGIVVVCDPNNPTGVKLNDEDLFKNLTGITSIGTTVIFDSPYRRMRRDRSDDFFRRISRMPNIVIVESFSKSLGMPGMRIAFLRSSDKELMKAVRTRLTYGFSGVNMFAQQVVEYLLTNPDGQQIVTEFKEQTNTEIIKNIQWLSVHGLLEQSLYTDTPDGIFAIVNKSEEEMIANRIGAVSLDFFTELPELRERYANASRICVSVPHTRFVKFFSRLTL